MAPQTRTTSTGRRVTCLEGGVTHAWESVGLDNVDGVLSTVRRCVWCRREQHRAYGGGGKKPWREGS